MIESALLQSVTGVRHGFADAHDEPRFWPGPRPEWKQVHGTRVAEVTTPGQAVGEADGLRTRLAGLPIGIVTADCVPILLARRDGTEVAALHAGWRGTYGGIAGAFARAVADPADWVAAIGPCAGPCCYEVSEEIARDFSARFGVARGPLSRYLDLAAVNEAQLRAAGLGAVEILRHCTICERGSGGAFRFHSFRRDGTPGRQRAQIRRELPP